MGEMPDWPTCLCEGEQGRVGCVCVCVLTIHAAEDIIAE